MDELKAKYGDDMQKMQSEQMKLYQQVGVNPISGCIPLLLQMPFLLAMFYFFPNAIELRQEPFLWADDLSTYDAIIFLGCAYSPDQFILWQPCELVYFAHDLLYDSLHLV